MTSHGSLEDYYTTVFSLVQYHKWTVTEVENLYPYERDAYVGMLMAHLRELEDRRRQQGE